MSLLKKNRSGTLKKSKSKSIDIQYTTEDLPSLRRKRTIAYKRLTKALEVGMLAVSDHSQRDLFLSYHQEVKNIAANFEDAHFTIQEILDDPENEDNEIQERFDEMYYKVLSFNRTFSKGDSNHSHSIGNASSNIRLPKITLPTFSGDVKKWPEYFDTFNALIHKSPSLSDTEKFHYLLSSLSGDALTVIKPFPITHEHYHDAYEALTARFTNKRDLAFTCWRDILNVDFKFNDAREFRKSLDLLEENLSILKTVNLPVGQWDFILVYHILSKLDSKLRRDFEEDHSDVELPTYAQLKSFLHSKCEASLRDTHFVKTIKSNELTKGSSTSHSQPKRFTPAHTLVAATAQKQPESTPSVPYTSKCSFCSDFHSITACSEFIKNSYDEQMQIATEKNWCFNCLKSSHRLKDCRSIFSCRTCKRKHHTLLHRDNHIESHPTVSSLVSRSPMHTTVLLATAIVQVKDAFGTMQSFRALFDTGSQSNFITESAITRLNLHPTPINATVCGLGEAPASILGDVRCAVGTNDTIFFDLDLHVISKICGDQPIAKLNTSGWSHIQSLPLADPGFDIPGSIDLLLAADVFTDSLLSQQIKGNVNQPTAFNSVFGWLLLGKTDLASSTLVHTSLHIDSELNSLVQHHDKTQLLSDLPSQDCSSVSLDNSESSTLKVLSLQRNPSLDAFLSEIKLSERPCTKRFILSELARIFDSLGFLSPITIQIKSYIQKLWILGIGWDQTPPDEIIHTWTTYMDQLPQLAQFRIPRKVTCSETISCELHGFCDSSETANGAVFYLRVTDKDGAAHVFLVCSKVRVARIKIDGVYLWSDSTVVLSWLRSHSSCWTTFVANRVSQIQDLSPTECWHHVFSGDNPADVCSRGQFPSELLHNSLWWAGPCWFSQNHEPSSSGSILHDNDVTTKAEERKVVILVPIIETLLNRFSSSSKLVNVLSYIYSFINNSRISNKSNRKELLNNVEHHHALMQIVKLINFTHRTHLQPGHFQTLELLTAVPDEDLSHLNLPILAPIFIAPILAHGVTDR